jgi:hypothetical protein
MVKQEGQYMEWPFPYDHFDHYGRNDLKMLVLTSVEDIPDYFWMRQE